MEFQYSDYGDVQAKRRALGRCVGRTYRLRVSAKAKVSYYTWSWTPHKYLPMNGHCENKPPSAGIQGLMPTFLCSSYLLDLHLYFLDIFLFAEKTFFFEFLILYRSITH